MEWTLTHYYKFPLLIIIPLDISKNIIIKTFSDTLFTIFESHTLPEQIIEHFKTHNINKIIEYYKTLLDCTEDNKINYLNLGTLYFINEQYPEMLECYLNSINLGCDQAMNNLGHYYKLNKNNLSLKYFKMAKKLNNADALYNLGYYYKLQNNDNKYIKCMLKAIDLHHDYAMKGLGYYYGELGDFENMMKYFLMGVEFNNSSAMCSLGRYYGYISDFKNMKIWYIKAINLGNTCAMTDLGTYYYKSRKYIKAYLYYLMTYNLGDYTGARSIAIYYGNKRDYLNMIKFYRILLQRKDKYIKDVIEDINCYFPYNQNIPIMVEFYEYLNENNRENCKVLWTQKYCDLIKNGKR